MSDLIFIVGRQRSGTTVFRELLDRNGAFNCDEILHGDIDRPHRFYGYVNQRVAAKPHLIHPQHHPGLFWDYIQDLRAQADGKKLAMDVKYFGLNLIAQREDVMNEQPFIVGFMRNSNAHVVHIIRRNKLRVFVSEQIALVTGGWSAEKPEQLVQDKPKLTVDVGKALSFIDNSIVLDERVTKVLDKVPGCRRIFYDEMFDDDGLFAPHVQTLAADILEQSGDYSTPGNLKLNPEGLDDLVLNYDELAQTLDQTDHSWMLTDVH